ncbi:hypothetical protein MC28_1535 [Bacillus thuringiensis MC28]|nr:hypothetical protein MC28_1535 [Bacillus thuringiensis MC28]
MTGRVEANRSQKMKVNEECTQIYKQKHKRKMPVIHFLW